ncbi:MAG: glycosyltransferase, partial [Nostoc sp.]
NLRRLVAKAVQEDLDLVSVMVRLRCESFWEKLLIPAFVFFFQKLYPFRWVNNPNNPTAAAAGGSILIAREALERIGGIQVIRQALIDDCALAQAVKRSEGVGSREWG